MGKRRSQSDKTNNVESLIEQSTPSKKKKIDQQLSNGDHLPQLDEIVNEHNDDHTTPIDHEQVVNKPKKVGRPKKNSIINKKQPIEKKSPKKVATKQSKSKFVEQDNQDQIAQQAVIDSNGIPTDSEDDQINQPNSSLKKFDFVEFANESKIVDSSLSTDVSEKDEQSLIEKNDISLEESIQETIKKVVNKSPVDKKIKSDKQAPKKKENKKVAKNSTIENTPESTPKRGRPKKQVISSEDNDKLGEIQKSKSTITNDNKQQISSADSASEKKTPKRGRPSKKQEDLVNEPQANTAKSPVSAKKVKLNKKQKIEQTSDSNEQPQESTIDTTSTAQKPAKRGRPPKASSSKETTKQTPKRSKLTKKANQSDDEDQVTKNTNAIVEPEHKIEDQAFDEDKISVDLNDDSLTDTEQLQNKVGEDQLSISASNETDSKMSGKFLKNALKIVSFNVNGVRSCSDKGLIDFMAKEDADIFCLQELKCSRNDMPSAMNELDYNIYWNVPSDKAGYAGVATFSKDEPLKVILDMDNADYEGEGRVVTCEYEKFYLVNVYATNAGRGLERLSDKRDFNLAFQNHLIKLDSKKPVVACGDFNCAHTEIDLANPKTNTKTAGFTPEERQDFSELLDNGFFDSFRDLNPDLRGAYTFWTYMRNSRQKNIGWRLDYFLLSNRLKKKLLDSIICNDVLGSDHCPITLFLNV